MKHGYKITVASNNEIAIQLTDNASEANFYPPQFIGYLVSMLGYHDTIFYLMSYLFNSSQKKPSLIENFDVTQFCLDIKEVYNRHFPEQPPQGIDGWGYVDEKEYEIFLLRINGELGDDTFLGGNPAKQELAWDAYRNPAKYDAIVSAPNQWKDYDGRFCQIYLVRVPANAVLSNAD
ncbi:hypothetical protein FD723_40490 (plasmid) [Nostoc sp. C052]|uniref:hypothetical protein n=1 Tax=Nostoc sp. C052 TaxID=2576902 RepID=UPI0015C3E715|nr:hypothetical protein [Nostoc sp. C052]QLE46493.1 hypothetical protein FD723_40490 [Nostoc sp. C052]